MLTNLKYDIKMLLNRKEFYWSICIMLLITTIHLVLNIYTKINFPSINGNAGNYSVFVELLRPYAYQLPLSDIDVPYKYVIMLLFPLLASFIYSDSYITEKKYKVTNYLSVRMQNKKNVISKAIIIFVFSFSIVFIILIFNMVINAMIFPTSNTSDIYGHHIYDLEMVGDSMLEYWRAYQMDTYVVLNLLRFSFITSLISVMTYVISLFINNRIVVNFSPLIIMLVSHLFLTTVGLTPYSLLSVFDFNMYIQMNHFIIVSLLLIVFIIGGISYSIYKRKDVLC